MSASIIRMPRGCVCGTATKVVLRTALNRLFFSLDPSDMIAIRRSADNGVFASQKQSFVAGPAVTCPNCSETFNLYATPESVEASEKALRDYLRRNCPRHVEFFGADESAIRTSCSECVEAFNVLGLWPGAGNARIKAAYRELVKKWHPDTCSESDEQLRQQAEAHFKQISKAYKHLNTHG